MKTAAPSIPLTLEHSRLIEENVGLIWFSARSFYRKFKDTCDSVGLDPPELYGVGLDAVFKAAAKYDEGKSKIGTFIPFVCGRAFSTEMRHRKPQDGSPGAARSIDEPEHGPWRPPLTGFGDDHGRHSGGDIKDALAAFDCDPSRRLETSELVNLILSCLTDRERQILHMRADERTMESIGQSLGLTRQRIDQILRQIEEKARKKLGLDETDFPA